MTVVLLLSTYWSVIQSGVIQVTWLGLQGKEDLGDYLKLPVTKSYTEMFKDKKVIVLEWVSSVSWKRLLLLQHLTTGLWEEFIKAKVPAATWCYWDGSTIL